MRNFNGPSGAGGTGTCVPALYSKRARSAKVVEEVEVRRRWFEVAWLVEMLVVCLDGFSGGLRGCVAVLLGAIGEALWARARRRLK